MYLQITPTILLLVFQYQGQQTPGEFSSVNYIINNQCGISFLKPIPLTQDCDKLHAPHKGDSACIPMRYFEVGGQNSTKCMQQ